MVQVGLDIMSLRLRLSTPRFVDAGWGILPEYTAAGSELACDRAIKLFFVLLQLTAPRSITISPNEQPDGRMSLMGVEVLWFDVICCRVVHGAADSTK